MARPAGIEPATPGLGILCSIQLSYERVALNNNDLRQTDLQLILCSNWPMLQKVANLAGSRCPYQKLHPDWRRPSEQIDST